MDTLEYINEIDRQYRLQDALYHTAAVKLHLSDSAMYVLYVLASENGCTQQALSTRGYFPKQTVNSAVMNLVKNEIVALEPLPGTRNQKKIFLTEKGHALVKQKIEPLMAAERRAYGIFSNEELAICLRAMTQLTASLKAEFEALQDQE